MRQGSTRLMAVLGFGLGCVAIAANLARAGDDERPLPDSQYGYRTAPILLLTRPDIQAELGLSPDQVKSAQKAATTLWLRVESLRGKHDQASMAANQAIKSEMQEWITTKLSADQQVRLVQLDLQWEGPSALLTRPVIGHTLNLSKEQRKTLQEAVARRDAARKQGKNEDHLLLEASLRCLTPEQKDHWLVLLGHPATLVQPAKPVKASG